MKLHSDNIVAKTGIVAIHNLNVFEGTIVGRKEFRESCKRAAILAEKAFFTMSEDDRIEDHFSLVELSVPRFSILSIADHYRLDGGIFLWGGLLFLPGAEFRVTDSAVENLGAPELIQRATAIPVEMKEMRYDTYNGEWLGDIADKILDELDLKLDKNALKSLEEEDDGTSMHEVKYLSIYAPDLKETAEGRAIAYVDGKTPGVGVDLDFDTKYFDSLISIYHHHGATSCIPKYYDEFFVEFIDKKQPFAYVTIELIGQPAGGNAEASYEVQVDAFAKMFDQSNKDELLTHDRKQIVETLRAMGGLPAML